MPRNITRLWIICCSLILIGFIYASLQIQARELESQRQEKAMKGRELSKRKEAKEERINRVAEKIKEIKELNALGQHADAVWLAEKTVKEYSGNALAHTWWGISLVKTDKSNEAMGKFIEAARLDPTNPKTFLYWGLTLAMADKLKEAIDKYRISINLDPDSSNAFAYWGAALERLGDYDQAIEKLEYAIELNKFNSLVYGVLVDTWYHKREYQKAWEAVFRARNVKVEIDEDSLRRLSSAMPEPN